jgi:poly(hydroxyalkanoate) depolymerase family esterase
MHPHFQRILKDATRLVREGRLRDATAAIQAALRGSAEDTARAEGVPAAAEGIVIDVPARELDPPRAPQPELQEPEPGLLDPGPGSFIAGRFSDGRMQRQYKLYVPPQAGERPLPLVVMLHGCTQDPDDFAAGTQMNEAARVQGVFVLYPEQSRQANPQRCWNWFKHSHQQRGRGEPALLAAMTREIRARHPIDPARVYVAGLSAGGAMAAILGETYPDVYAAVGVHSGLRADAASDLPSALAVMRSGPPPGESRKGPPTIVFHGDADATVHPANGESVVGVRVDPSDTQAEVQRQQAAGGRAYTRRVHRSTEGGVLAEHWVVHGSGHAWSGGSPEGSFTDPSGPDATAQMLRFFLQHAHR